MKLSSSTYLQIFITFDKLIHMNSPKLTDLMVILCRIFFPGKWLNERVSDFFIKLINSHLKYLDGIIQFLLKIHNKQITMDKREQQSIYQWDSFHQNSENHVRKSLHDKLHGRNEERIDERNDATQ